MFARISGSLAGDLVVDNTVGASDAYAANVWIWSEQTILAQRRRFNCAPFQSINGNNSSDHSSQQHGTSLVCRASRRSKQPHTGIRRPRKYGAPQGAHKHSSFAAVHSTPHPSSSNNSSSWQTAAQLQKQQPTVDQQQLTACINAATSYHQLESLCNTFLHNPSFSSRHAALVISRLHKVHNRHQDSQLLLVELLAAKLLPAAACSSNDSSNSGNSTSASCSSSSNADQQLCPDEAAAVVWGFARAGYQADAQLLQHLLQQFWAGYGLQQQQQAPANPHDQQQPQHITLHSHDAAEASSALASLIAGLAGLGFRDTAIWARLQSKVTQEISDLSPASLQQIIWGFATAQRTDPTITGALAAAVGDRLVCFSPEDLAQVVWCLHVMGYKDAALFEQASQQLVHRVHGGTSSSSSSHRLGRPLQQQQQPGQLRRHSTQHRSNLQQQQQASSSSGVVAVLCSAAASQAYSVLEKYDPLLSTLLLYEKLKPAHSC